MKGSFKAALVGMALASHITGVYVVGATRDEWLSGYSANFPSILFVLATALLVVEQCLLPRTKCPLPPFFVHAYYVLAVIFMTSMALRLVWLPLSLWVVRMNLNLATALCGISAMKQPPLNGIIKFLECPNFQTTELLVLAMYMLWVVINATGAYEHIRCWINQILNKCDEEEPYQAEMAAPCEDVRDSTPEDVEVDAARRPPGSARRHRYTS